MSVESTRARLAAHYRLISGITKVFDRMPNAIQREELPAVVIRVTAAEFSQSAADGSEVSEEHYFERRIYRAQLYVNVISDGVEGAVEEAMMPFLDSVRDYFQILPGLQFTSEPEPAVYSHELQGDTGAVTTAQYPKETGTTFSVVEFRHQIEELYHRIFTVD